MPSIQKVSDVYKATNRFAKDNETRHFIDRYDDTKKSGNESSRNDSKKSFDEILKDKLSKSSSARQ